MPAPKIPRGPKLPKLPSVPTIFTRGPRHMQSALMGFEHASGPGGIPPNLVATLPEWYAYWALLKLGKRPGIDFAFQSPILGGRLSGGGSVMDFILYDPPDLAIDIQGEYWHYEQGSAKQGQDRIQRIQIAGYGITLIYIDESDALRDPIYYVEEALSGRDHSRLNEA